MKLYLIRHGIASETIGGAVRSDSERPLTDEGRQETEAVAKGMRALGIRPDAVVASPLVRARQTAEIIAEVLGVSDKLELATALAPGINMSDLYRVINKHRRLEEIVLVGHHPDMTLLAHALLGVFDLDLPFEKAAVARIDVYDLPPTEPGTLRFMLPPTISTKIN